MYDRNHIDISGLSLVSSLLDHRSMLTAEDYVNVVHILVSGPAREKFGSSVWIFPSVSSGIDCLCSSTR
jgi:hypothetical protein